MHDPPSRIAGPGPGGDRDVHRRRAYRQRESGTYSRRPAGTGNNGRLPLDPGQRDLRRIRPARPADVAPGPHHDGPPPITAISQSQPPAWLHISRRAPPVLDVGVMRSAFHEQVTVPVKRSGIWVGGRSQIDLVPPFEDAACADEHPSEPLGRSACREPQIDKQRRSLQPRDSSLRVNPTVSSQQRRPLPPADEAGEVSGPSRMGHSQRSHTATSLDLPGIRPAAKRDGAARNLQVPLAQQPGPSRSSCSRGQPDAADASQG
jgi:hypothetical protein